MWAPAARIDNITSKQDVLVAAIMSIDCWLVYRSLSHPVLLVRAAWRRANVLPGGGHWSVHGSRLHRCMEHLPALSR